MKKIISLFQRNYDGDRLVRDEVVPGAEWVLEGQGRATRKWDGTCCLVLGQALYRRYDAKHGKTPPAAWFSAQPDPDPVTGHWPGWLPLEPEGKHDAIHREAFALGVGFTGRMAGTFSEAERFIDGATYELVGPRINGNPEKAMIHILVRHGALEIEAPRTFLEIKAFLGGADIEGIVWWHEDGRKVKIKTNDFGLRRG